MELTMDYWAKPAVSRRQMALFSPTLDEAIGEHDAVRLFDEILSSVDWKPWEGRYHGRVGQPPIHPRWLAGPILYGLTKRVHSSRELEDCCTYRFDFRWISNGFTPDHSTFCEFRTKFGKELKGLFRQVGALAIRMGLVRLGRVGLDGTRVRANSSRHATATAKTLEARLAVLDEQIEEAFAQAKQEDQHDQKLFGSDGLSDLPAELRDLQRRQEKLAQAIEKARKTDAKRAARKDGPKRPAAVPVADPDSAVLPNKEGGYAPNYSPMAAVDGESGFVVDCDVHAEATEAHTTIETVDRIEETFGQKPEQFLADSAHGTGENLEAMEARGVDAYIPPEGVHTGANPSRREDPRVPVAAEQWDALPRNKQSKKLDKAAFVYVEEKDCYYCPMGRELVYQGRTRQRRREHAVTYRQYRCVSCRDCPLKSSCTGAEARTVNRDQYSQQREAMAAKMATSGGQATYLKRKHICETLFGWVKGVKGIRQFLLRGQEKVRTEWLWICTASNLSKLAREMRRLRGPATARTV